MRVGAVLLVLLLSGCDDDPPLFDAGAPTDAGEVETDAGFDAGPVSDAGPSCGCAPGIHNDRIVLVSDDAALWSYEPMTDTFTRLGDASCMGQRDSFSMGVDANGLAWIQFGATEDLFTIDVNDPGAGCTDPGYDPGASDFGLFGLSFASDRACEDLYLWSYSGTGLFREGPDLGRLGALDVSTLETRAITSVDFDGGELAGTSDGRLYALAGDPARLLELDPTTGAIRESFSLGGLSLTTAFAFAFFGGDAWFFTVAPPADCEPCLMRECEAERAACRADPGCNAQLECALGIGEVTDSCGGALPDAARTCLVDRCATECLTNPGARNSRVTRFDLETGTTSVASPEAPLRVVGAGNSTCVPLI